MEINVQIVFMLKCTLTIMLNGNWTPNNHSIKIINCIYNNNGIFHS